MKLPLHSPTKSQSILSKIGNTVGAIAAPLSKILPGVAGKISGALANLFNDPEWWEHVEGSEVTLNTSLSLITAVWTRYTDEQDQSTAVNCNVGYLRPQFCEIVSRSPLTMYYRDTKIPAYAPIKDDAGRPLAGLFVMAPTYDQVNQYLIKYIRGVINAVPLATLGAYMNVFAANATLYAIWRYLKKCQWIAANTPQWMVSMSDEAFPILQIDNAETLQALTRRVEEALRSNVRLPHTLCQYLAWRYGRVYLSADSKKAAWVLHNPIPITTPVDKIRQVVNYCISVQSYDEDHKLATADIFNAYASHDQDVVIADSTQGKFDKKEWMLRINLSVTRTFYINTMTPGTYDPYGTGDLSSVDNSFGNKPVIIDSSLDNKTVFMASTVSTACNDLSPGNDDEGITQRALFPVDAATAFINNCNDFTVTVPPTGQNPSAYNAPVASIREVAPGSASKWGAIPLNWSGPTVRTSGAAYSQAFSNQRAENQLAALLAPLMAAKALDCYNMGIYQAVVVNGLQVNIDLTAISIDMAMVPQDTLQTEQDYAFANLTDIETRHYESKKQLTAEVATEVKDLVADMTSENVTPVLQ